MDIVTHMVTGAAVGTVAASFGKTSGLKKAGIILSGVLGGFLPDIDVISLWGGFDATFGKLFGLQHKGTAIYSAKFWYSHHAFMHSLLAAVSVGFLFLLITYLFQQKFKGLGWQSLKKSLGNNKLPYLSFVLGFVAHLVCDMITPAATWGGVNLFFPAKSYVGGWGYVWWWNNYDIFLLIVALLVVNILCLLVASFYKKMTPTKFCVSTLVVCIILIGVQCATRPVDFNYTGHTKKFNKFEQQSKDIQKKILGNKLYPKMERFDNAIPGNF